MHRTDLSQLKEHLMALGLRPGDNVWVHSRLLSFGLIEGGVETVWRALREVIGDEGTVVVPTYRLQADPQEVFDRATSPSVNVGPLPEFVRLLPESVRSRCPMHNHTAHGPLAHLMLKADGTRSLGPGSDFEEMRAHGFKNLYLGVGGKFFSDSATFAVHVQAMFGNIPYREWMELPRLVQEDGQVRPFTVHYYGRKGLAVDETLMPAADLLRAAKALQCAPCPYGESYCINLQDYFEVVYQELERNPLLFVLTETEQGR